APPASTSSIRMCSGSHFSATIVGSTTNSSPHSTASHTRRPPYAAPTGAIGSPVPLESLPAAAWLMRPPRRPYPNHSQTLASRHSRSRPVPAHPPSPVIVAAKRTPIGRFFGGLSKVPSPQLGSYAIQALFADSPQLKDAVDEVIMGCVLQA